MTKKKDAPKILMVDENVTRRNNNAQRLRLQGYIVELAMGGFHAIHLVEKDLEEGRQSIDLVFVVGDMEDMPGEEICSLIRHHVPDKGRLPVLFMSEEQDPAQIMILLQDVQINDFLKDTDNFAHILEKIKKNCKRKPN